MKHILQFLLFFCISAIVLAEAPYKKGDVLVQTLEGQSIEAIVGDLKYVNGQPTRLRVVEELSRVTNIWLLHFDADQISHPEMLRALFTHDKVRQVQNNHTIQFRETTPDDTLFDDQWQYVNPGGASGVEDADIDADQAWDFATGGTTPLGHDIVVAVIDDGIDLDHSDIEPNLWINTEEIPDNGIDDDENGYVDDIYGWNADDNNGNVQPSGWAGGHGTPVAGIVGAKGNDANGVCGVNWDVKLMIIINGGTAESEVIEAYSYALEQRLLFNETGGSEGAFVVSANSSWGIDGGDPEDSPLWCGFYDTMGEAGIINCGATINGNQNVDTFGDLPTGCSSDYLLSVTNMNSSNVKVNQAGYGLETIDLGAYGANTYTVASGGGYDGFGGTSGATPHVAGAIALLYSSDCAGLTEFALVNPGQAALDVRQMILDGVEPNESLDGITVTGGVLNLYNSMLLVTSYDCNSSGCFAPNSIEVSSSVDTDADLSWNVFSDASTFFVEYREAGTEDWSSPAIAYETSYTITGLMGCTEYEVQISAVCADGAISSFSAPVAFTTEGCCVPPSDFSFTPVGESAVEVNFDAVFAGTVYNLTYTTSGESNTVTFSEVPYLLTGLSGCTSYDVSVMTVCGNADAESEDSEIISFITSGCGVCIESDYCDSFAEDSSYEFLNSLIIGDLVNESGNNGGYANFTDISTNFSAGGNYEVELEPGYGTGTQYDEYWRIWVDLNQDGEFDDQFELLLDSEYADNETFTGDIFIPLAAVNGSTRMRVTMKYVNPSDDPDLPDSCMEYAYGETEDYCVTITGGLDVGINDQTTKQIQVAPNPFDQWVNVQFTAQDNEQAQIVLTDVQGRSIQMQNADLNAGANNITINTENVAAGIYFLQVRTAAGTLHTQKLIKLGQ